MITLRLDKNGGINKGDIKAFEHDNKSDTYIIQLYKEGQPYDLSNKTVELTILERKRKIGDIITLPIYDIAEGKVKLEIVSDITKQEGLYDFKLTVKDTTGLIETFPNFQVDIKKDITDDITGEIIQDPNFSIIEEGLKGLEEYNTYKTNALKVPEIEQDIVEINEQLDNKANELYQNQEDFCETLKRMYKPKKMNIVINEKDSFNFSIINEVGENNAIQYSTFTKTYQGVRDEYVLLGEGRYGNLEQSDLISAYEHCDSKTGEWVELYPPSFYATEVGATMTKSFYGNRLDFYSFGDTRGGIWEFVIDGDIENKVTLSTWRETAGAIPARTIFKSNENGQHTVVATFKGDDPEHEPSTGAGTSRGWTYYNDNGNQVNSFYVYKNALFVNSIVKPLFSTSNKEFAMEVRKNGTTNPYHFCPYHDVVTSKFIEQPKIYIDGILMTEFENKEVISNVSEFKIIQRLNAINPESSDKLAEITTVTTFRNDGSVSVDGKYKALCDLDIKTGYGIMFIFDTTFNKRFLSSIRKEYVTTDDKIGTNLYMPTEKDKTTSFISLSDTYKNLALACTFNNPKETLRQGMNGKTDLDHITWLNYRDKSLTKLYQQSYYNTTINTGEVFRFSGTFLLAECENVYDLI